ncbi:helix-turn-helix domain-containing protein [Streptomyces longispororuber]|uniref:helix-turn-helix domain-containing protein n=1 Tax=Streptomyces longispororuber TaxID=68230 RepID=UPI00210AF9D9|nr:pyridoxamine 5'-phosphate oxidase family protein [Streptomyces longispororuber]MCQ4210659.1 pyridoxamine 5'-phosphate oxidase family protein [Streptomyces longispororuber]
MSEARQPTETTPVQHSDFGRRVATRRQELGLTPEDLAERTGASAAYVRYVEGQAAQPGSGFALRLADALDTSLDELQGGTYTRPPGTADKARDPEFLELSEQQCRALLATHGVGRLAAQLPQGPVVLPVNYTVTPEGGVAFRTRPGSALTGASGQEVAFEVDRVDDALSEGWSVLIVGVARTVADPDTARSLDRLAHTEPWAGGDRTLWVSITPRRITGRRIRRGTA